jgi:hypothetical protein
MNKGQLIMDLDFKWGAGDPRIVLALGTSIIGAGVPIVKVAISLWDS